MPTSRRTPGPAEAPEALALSTVQFIASEGDRLQRFLDLSGIAPESLRLRLGEPAFLAGVLDYLLGDEALLLEFAHWASLAPSEIAAARRSLGGWDDAG